MLVSPLSTVKCKSHCKVSTVGGRPTGGQHLLTSSHAESGPAAGAWLAADKNGCTGTAHGIPKLRVADCRRLVADCSALDRVGGRGLCKSLSENITRDCIAFAA